MPDVVLERGHRALARHGSRDGRAGSCARCSDRQYVEQTVKRGVRQDDRRRGSGGGRDDRRLAGRGIR